MARIASGSGRSDRALARLFPVFERLGFHVTRNHFYEPIPDLRTIPDDWFERRFELPGVDMRDREQLELLTQLASYRDDFERLALRSAAPNAGTYFVQNGQFGSVDAEVLYGMIRLRRPHRIIEVGSGYSTLVALMAADALRADDPGHGIDIVCVEPHPRDFLRGLPVRLLEQPVQTLPLEVLTDLGPSDILFIDSSHVAKVASDVQFEFLELLPRLPVGVLVQVHDIWFPTEYPSAFVREWHRFWNEQYLLQAFLAFNRAWVVRWGSNWMMTHHESELRDLFPTMRIGSMRPSSLWIERVGE